MVKNMWTQSLLYSWSESQPHRTQRAFLYRHWVGALGCFHVETRKDYLQYIATHAIVQNIRLRISDVWFTSKRGKIPRAQEQWVCSRKLCWHETLSPLGHTALNTHRFISASQYVWLHTWFFFKLSQSYLCMTWKMLFFSVCILFKVCPCVPVDCVAVWLGAGRFCTGSRCLSLPCLLAVD